MSSSEDEIKAMHAELQHVSSTKELLARPALQLMLGLIDPSFSVSPAEFIRKYLAQIKAAEGPVKITASDTTVARNVEVFGLTLDRLADTRWTLAKDNILQEPKILRRNLSDLIEAFYGDQSEATCRISIDIILVQCRKYLRSKYKTIEAKPAFLAAPSTHLKGAPNVPPTTQNKPVKL